MKETTINEVARTVDSLVMGFWEKRGEKPVANHERDTIPSSSDKNVPFIKEADVRVLQLNIA